VDHFSEGGRVQFLLSITRVAPAPLSGINSATNQSEAELGEAKPRPGWAKSVTTRPAFFRKKRETTYP